MNRSLVMSSAFVHNKEFTLVKITLLNFNVEILYGDCPSDQIA